MEGRGTRDLRGVRDTGSLGQRSREPSLAWPGGVWAEEGGKTGHGITMNPRSTQAVVKEGMLCVGTCVCAATVQFCWCE